MDIFKKKEASNSSNDPFSNNGSNLAGVPKQNPVDPSKYRFNPPQGGTHESNDPFASPSFQNSVPSASVAGDPFSHDHDAFTPQNNAPFPDNLPSHEAPSQSQGNNAFHGDMSHKNQELILSKLDAIRMAIQNLDHRLTNIESKLQPNNTPNSPENQSGVGYDTFQ